MEKDYFKISESEEGKLSLNTSYSVYLSEVDIDRLKRIQKHHRSYFEKQKTALSTMIRTIIENTYLYLNNMERNFNEDLSKILSKDYYKDSIDKKFEEKLKGNTKEHDLFLELLRTQLVRLLSKKEDESELVKIQFRLTKEDDRLLRIISGNKVHNLNDFFAGYLRYFLSLPIDTQTYILTYPVGLKIDRAIKDRRYIVIDGIKYKPYKVVNAPILVRCKNLLCFDSICDSFCEVPHVYLKDIELTEEYYDFNSFETDVIDAYNDLEYIEASFKILNDENKDINNLVAEDSFVRSYKVLNLEQDGPLKKIKIRYNEKIIDDLNKAYKKNIDYLCFSDNYNRYIKLTEQKKKEFKKYIKVLDKE